MKKLILFSLFFGFAYHQFSHTQDNDSTPGLTLSLNDSANIILNLVLSNNLSSVFESTNASQIELIIKNFSPAELAFESEVLSSTQPVLVYFYKNSSEHDAFKPIFETSAQTYANEVKYVEIDVEQIFSIAQKADVLFLPTLIFITNRREINRIEGVATEEELNEAIAELITAHNKKEQQTEEK